MSLLADIFSLSTSIGSAVAGATTYFIARKTYNAALDETKKSIQVWLSYRLNGKRTIQWKIENITNIDADKETDIGDILQVTNGESVITDQTSSNHMVPPLTADKVLYFFLPKDAREHIPGDLEEELNTIILPKFGVKYARQWYWGQVLQSIFMHNVVTARVVTIIEKLKKSSGS